MFKFTILFFRYGLQKDFSYTVLITVLINFHKTQSTLLATCYWFSVSVFQITDYNQSQVFRKQLSVEHQRL